MKNGIALIAEERARQIGVEGWTLEHDKTHKMGEMTEAALCYGCVASSQIRGASVDEWPVSMFNGHCDSLLEWPFDKKAYKPSPHAVRNLIKAGALIAAEIDRLHYSAGVPVESAAIVTDSTADPQRARFEKIAYEAAEEFSRGRALLRAAQRALAAMKSPEGSNPLEFALATEALRLVIEQVEAAG